MRFSAALKRGSPRTGSNAGCQTLSCPNEISVAQPLQVVHRIVPVAEQHQPFDPRGRGQSLMRVAGSREYPAYGGGALRRIGNAVHQPRIDFRIFSANRAPMSNCAFASA